MKNASRARRLRPAPLFPSLLLAAALLAGAAPCADARDDARLRLGAHAQARVAADGVVDLLEAAHPDAVPLLRITSPWTAAAAARVAPFLLLTGEGDPDGHRGLSARADDDGDGRTDEDPADGRDNDGDGLVDEDFAAVGETMVALDRSDDDARRRLEASHWSLPHLSEAVVLRWRVDAADPAPAVFELPDGAWSVGELGWNPLGDAAVARRPLLAARVTPGPGQEYWVGVTLLDGGAAALAGRRLDGPRLELPVDGALSVAVAVTRTPHQLRCRLAAVHVARRGAAAAPGQERTPWIVPPPPTRPRGVFGQTRSRTDEQGRTVIELTVPSEWTLLLDPETMALEGASLGRLRAASWERLGPEADGPDAAWSTVPAPVRGAAPPPHLYADLPAAARRGPSLWTFVFDGRRLPEEPAPLEVRTLCGLPLQFTLEPAPPVLTVAEADGGTSRRPMLAPHLLENYPNPFRDQLSVRFTVPSTVGEGFVWDEGEEPSLKATDPIPYASPTPRAILTVYSLAGHEVAKLFDEQCAPGSYGSRWNGLDRDGRPVAAGTYFCKLQIENWSVTKRVALIR